MNVSASLVTISMTEDLSANGVISSDAALSLGEALLGIDALNTDSSDMMISASSLARDAGNHALTMTLYSMQQANH